MPESHDQNQKSRQRAEGDFYSADDPGKLDADVERVRCKLLRLMIISIMVTLLLVGAVLAAVIYKITRPAVSHQIDAPPAAGQAAKPGAMMGTKPVDLRVTLAPGARFVSQSISGNLICLETLKPDNSIELIVYDYRAGTMIARLHLAAGDPPPDQSTQGAAE